MSETRSNDEFNSQSRVRFRRKNNRDTVLSSIIPIILMVATAFSIAVRSYGHSGGLDANGCHAGSKPYHCHRAPSEMVGNRLRCDLGSRSKDCVGSATRSSGYGSSPLTRPENTSTYKAKISPRDKSVDALVVRRVQSRLRLMGLYEGSVDGILGSQTAMAIDLFKIKKGLELGTYLDPATLSHLGVQE